MRNVFIALQFWLSLVCSFFGGSMILPTMAKADNPLILARPSSDPAPSVFNGVLYLYTTQDKLGTTGYKIDTVHCYTTTDLYHWKDSGCALDEAHVSWAHQGYHILWAPAVVYWSNTYMMYLPETNTNGTYYNFRATNTTPTGMFTAGTPLPGMEGNAIDPTPFSDTLTDSVRNWIHYRDGGGSEISLIRLNHAGDSCKGTKIIITSTAVSPGFPAGYKEGSWIIKRNGIYFLVFAFQPNSTGNEEIAYATATNIKGPYTFKNAIMTKNTGEFTIHSGCAYYNNQWIIFWHDVTFGGALYGACRMVGAQYLQWQNDSILPAPKTWRGIGVATAISDTLQIDRYSSMANLATTAISYPATGTEPVGWYLSGIANNSWVEYDSVNFTPTTGYAITNVCARVSSTVATDTIQVRLGSNTGTLLGKIPVTNTGSLNTWVTTPLATLTTTPKTGNQNLVCVFTSTTTGTCQVDWVKFGQTTVSGVISTPTNLLSNGFTYNRINKNEFQIKGISNASAANVQLFTLQGHDVTNAIATSGNVSNSLTVLLNARQLCSGAYIMVLKNGRESFKVPFVY